MNSHLNIIRISSLQIFRQLRGTMFLSRVKIPLKLFFIFLITLFSPLDSENLNMTSYFSSHSPIFLEWLQSLYLGENLMDHSAFNTISKLCVYSGIIVTIKARMRNVTIISFHQFSFDLKLSSSSVLRFSSVSAAECETVRMIWHVDVETYHSRFRVRFLTGHLRERKRRRKKVFMKRINSKARTIRKKFRNVSPSLEKENL